MKRFLMAAACLAIAAATPAAAADRTEVRLGHNYPTATHLHRGAEALANYFNEHNDRFEIEIYPAGQLYHEKGLVQGVQTGALDMSFVVSAAWGGTVPMIYVLNFPMLMGTVEKGIAAIEGKYGEDIDKEFEKAGVKLIGWIIYGPDDVIVNNVRPLQKPEDFEGLRLRSTGSLHGIMVGALGGGPTVMSASEVYMALQRGTFDGSVTGVTSVAERKWNEVTKYATILPLSFSALPVTVSRRFWNKLDEDEQQALLEAGRHATEASAEEANAIMQQNREKVRNALETIDLSEEDAMAIQKVAYQAARDYIQEVAGEDGLQALADAEEDIKNAAD